MRGPLRLKCASDHWTPAQPDTLSGSAIRACTRRHKSRHDYGRDRRSVLPRSALANLAAEQTRRPERVALLESQTGSRIAELTPIRYGRMSGSPLGFSRGGVAHGVGFRRRRPHRPRGAAVRACTPWQLRLVGSRAQAGLRHRRFRRDGARSPPTSRSPDSQRPMPTATSTTTRHCVGHSEPSTAGRTRPVSY